jgi:outer membrane protein assembly factor BamB
MRLYSAHRLLAAMALLFTVCLGPGSATASTASIAWRVEIDGRVNVPVALGPDGEIAVQGFEVVVIEADGSVRWRQDLALPADNRMCTIDGAGRIIASTGDDLRAFAPDGTLLWTALHNDGGFRPYAGPSVGPDGNIYVLDVTAQANGGRGFVSLTPDGAVRWDRPHENWALAEMGAATRRDIAFADGLALVSSPGMPCEGGCLASGVMAFTLDGDVVWSTETSTPHWLTPAVPGKVYLARDLQAFDILHTDDGSVTPVVLSPQPILTFKRVAVAPDGSGFVGTTPSSAGIRRLEPTGTSTVLAGDVGVPGVPAVSPDGSLLVVPTAESLLPSLNSLTGLDPTTGDVLWSVPMPPEADGDHPIAIGMPRFSEDGSFVYLTAASVEQSWVYAFEMPRTVGVTDRLAGSLADLDLRALAATGAGGASFQFRLPAAVPVTLEVHDLRGRKVATVIDGETLAPGENARSWNPGRLASGVYLARLQAGAREATAKLTLVR